MPRSRNRRKSGGVAKNNEMRAKHKAPPLPDRRAIEALLKQFSALATEDSDCSDPLSAAQDIMYDAWEAGPKAKRVSLAKKALKVSPLCADAYVLLAQETSRDLDEEIELYRNGVEAGEKALGSAAFKEDAGHFWGILETRPYMRARCGLAVGLWRKGKCEEAITHVRDMLRLNPNDNQGMRYALLAWLMELARHDESEALLADYEDDAAPQWLYNRALLAFVHGGDTAASRRVLADAVKSNKHAPAYLLGKALPNAQPAYLTLGGEDEAQDFARDALATWRKTPGALEWLALRTRCVR